MLQSFLLIDELAKSRLAADPASVPLRRSLGDTLPEQPRVILSQLGYRIFSASTLTEFEQHLNKVDAVILSVTPENVSGWRQKVSSNSSIPILWWCDPWTYPDSQCKLDSEIDGMLSSGMNPDQIHCSLLLAINHYFQRTEWQQEREQLLSKLEERKWIEQAKRILSELKGISEAEAYEFLRKQSMNERKRIVDVSTSIVKVYQLLQDKKKGGR